MKILLIILVIFTLNNETARALTQTVSKNTINEVIMNSETKVQKEIWKDVYGYECLYQVSNLGNIKSLNYNKTGIERLLKPGKDRGGYLIISLSKEDKIKTRSVHQLVAIAFLNHKPCGHKLVVNHIDFNKLNNNDENLEIITHRENSNKKHLKGSSKHVGVFWNKRANKWMASIMINLKSNHLGYFINELDASFAYQSKLKGIL